MDNERRLRHWMSGVAFHTHSRLDSLLEPIECRRESMSHDSLVSVDSLVWYAKRFLGDPNVLICDTDHPVHVLDRKGIPRKTAFRTDNLKSTIVIISEGILERARIIKDSKFADNILTGVEADILNTEGLVDIGDVALSKLDIVIASLHYSYWKIANSGLEPDIKMYIRSLQMAASNPHIDVIGHPTGDLQPRYIEQMKIDYWDELLETMAQNRVAYEINLSRYGIWKGLDEELIKRAVEHGVLFVIGLDFHSFYGYFGLNREERYVDIDVVPEVFERNKGEYNFQLFMQVRKVKRELEKLGVNADNLVNIDREHFTEWLTRRNEK